MKTFVHSKIKNWTGGYIEECYGPFNSAKGATQAVKYIRNVDANTGQYHNRTTVIRRKNEPEQRTLTWPEFVSTCNVIARERIKDFHTV